MLVRRWLFVIAATAGAASAAGLPAQGVDYAKADRIRPGDSVIKFAEWQKKNTF